MKKKRSKLISMLLTLVMTLSLVPAMGVTASAAEPEWKIVYTFDELKDAMQQGTKTNIKLGKDINTNDEENHKYGLTTYDQIRVGNTITLDLNGKKLTLNSGQNRMSVYIRVVLGSLTVQDSEGGGEIFLNDEYKGGSSLMQVESEATFTLKSGTLRATTPKPRSNGITLINNFGTVNIESGTLTCTQKDGSVNANGKLDDWSSCYALLSRSDSDSVQTTIKDGTFTGYVQVGVNNNGKQSTISGGTFNNDTIFKLNDEKNMTWTAPGLTISGGTFKGETSLKGVCYHEKSTDVAVIISGGTFDSLEVSGTRIWVIDKDLYDQILKESGRKAAQAAVKQGYYPYQLLGGTYGDLDFGGQFFQEYDPSLEHFHEAFRQLLGNGGIKVGDTFYPYSDIEKACCERNNDDLDVENPNNETITVIPNAAVWGVKSVTLDGDPIDYFKDWTGEWKRVGNNKEHTLVFEWYPLSEGMLNSGYTYDAKYLLHRTNSTDEPTPIPVDTSKNTCELKIKKDAEPGGYSYDFRLDLKKNGVDLSSSTNQHIVMLVVYPAQEIDNRTPIDSVTLNVPKLKEGDKSGADFTLSGTNTGVNNINTAWENIPSDGTVAGNFYVARITLTAEDGYAFNTKTQVNLNGDYSSQRSGIDNGGAGMTVLVSVPVRHEHKYGKWQIAGNDNVHFRNCSCGVQESKPHEWKYNDATGKYKCTVCEYEIDGEKESITHVYASPRSPIAGEHPGDYTAAEWVKIIGANYKVENIVWKDMNDNAVDTFESGKIYKGTVTFKADTGFAFDGSRIYASKIFDSSNAEVVGNYMLADGGTTLTATFKLKDEKVVRPGLNVKVKLPTLNDKIGKSLPEVELVDTTLPENVALVYSVVEGNIFTGTAITDPNYKVKPNQTYSYLAKLKLEGNSDITEAFNVSYEVKDGGDAETYIDTLPAVGVLAMYQTPDVADTSKISNVALTVTAPEYGEAPATSATGADGTFTVGTPEWSPEVTGGKFGADIYTVSIPVTAAEGHSFDANCLYTVNGYVATCADGKVSYTFPALTVPHEHDYTDQPWQYLDPGSHYQTCKGGDGGLNIRAHTFGTWEKHDENSHKATCSKCKHEKTENHSWVLDSVKEPTLDAAGTRYYKCSANGCTATKTESIPKLTAIPAVNVTVTAPVKDAAPEDATTAAGSPYSVAKTAWEPTVSGNFAGGIKYTVKVSLEANGDNRFTDKTTFQINGQTVKPDGKIPASGLDNTIITLTFPATEGGSTSGGSSGGGGGGGVTKYAVAVSPADNGKVTPDKTSAAKGSVVTITAMANDGYALDTIKATDKAGKEIKLTDKGDGKYTFTMPASKVEVKAAFKQTASKPDKPAEEMKTVVVMQVGSKTMFVNGKAYEKDAAPVIMNDRTLVPIRFVTESLGGKVAWNAETKEVTLVIDGKEIKMTIGKTIEKYGVAPVIINGRTFVPVRFVADELGATTAWNAETKTVTITKAVTPVKTEK